MTEVARTPSSFRSAVAAELEFPSALDVVAQRAVSPLGADAVRARRPSADPTEVREALATVAELATLLTERRGYEPRTVPDMVEVLDRLDTPGSVLDAAQLVQLAEAVAAIHDVARALQRLESDAPRVAALAVPPPPRHVEEHIRRAIDADGRVQDDASPELKRARRRIRETRARLVRLLGEIRVQAGGEGEVTVRGGRYVVPVRREDRAHVKGIVHGESGSGLTLFVEPAAAVELGNDLAQAEAEEARAVLAVLRGLTDEARPHAPEIDRGWHMCIRADDLYARARYALSTDAVLPDVVEAPADLRIVQGAHPLLAEAAGAVRFDLDLSRGLRTVVVSGPNAGGKTVLLKAVGLMTALAQSGVIPPVGRGTRLPVFGRIFADIGDHQSIAESLSTFSAHVSTLRQILAEADETSLVLLDELGGGTDPDEGAALAGAVLQTLHASGAVTVATTHLNRLKELAAQTDGVVNASLAFDGETLSPTYRFEQGKPGRSYGLAIARRLGLPEDVLDAAERLTPEEARTLESTLAELERREARLNEREIELETEAARMARDRNGLEEGRRTFDRRLAELEEREREAERAGRENARAFLLEARRRVEEALGVARAAVSEATAREARRLVEDAVREEGDALKKLEAVAGSKGWKIKTGIGNRESGVVAEARTDPDDSRFPIPDSRSRSEIDLRGLRVDEAERELVAAVDDAVVAGLPQLRVIHGKGTGALRAVVQNRLRGDKRVARFHLAPPAQGGSGVTIVEFES